ncbi:DUF4292 domain-containing protein [Sphingobacterium rhinopitheci]|uniref:DUF4292 domain-containing protein n=1 Tax=Sphingobacterium rhinopitheci TaxID=2781960 RepID=UPI001F518763|nr:DUF4292 domain-containing protein [Sphingobacterium rhinopitheci]MCI0922195.1 DUF4292 domain-containing protein [Sphingobacterium rhinopitheci]
MWSRGIIIMSLAIFLFSSCASKKKVVGDKTGTNPVMLNDGYTINNLDFHTFNGRAKTKVEFGDEKQDVTLHIRIDRDKAIWISVTATVVNYEAARILITPDTVKILNKLQSEYIVKPFSYIYKYAGEGINFAMLQDLILANVNTKLLRTENLTVASAADEVQLVGVINGLSFQYSLNENNRPKVFRLNAIGANENIEAFYSSFAAVTGYNFPQNQNLKVNAGALSINAILNYNKLEFNEPIEMPFTAPAKYKVVN